MKEGPERFSRSGPSFFCPLERVIVGGVRGKKRDIPSLFFI